MKLTNKLKFSLQLNLGVKFNTALSSQDKCYKLKRKKNINEEILVTDISLPSAIRCQLTNLSNFLLLLPTPCPKA